MNLSLEEIKAAAENGNARAMGILAANYVEQDKWGEAVHWFIAAADNGDETSFSPAARSCLMDAHALRNIAGGDRAFQCVDTLTKGLRYAEAAGIPKEDGLYGRLHQELGICWYLASLGDDQSKTIPKERCLEQSRLHLFANLSDMWGGWHYSPRDDEKAYSYFVKASQSGFDCSEMLAAFKKKMFGGHVFTG